MLNLKKLIFFLPIFFIVACSHFSISQKNNYVYLTGLVKFNLLQFSKLNKDITLNQYFSAEYKNNNFEFNLVTDISGDNLKLIALSDFGNRIFTIKYDGHNINATYPKLANINNNIKPEYIISDIQLSYFPLSVIKENLPHSIKIVETIKDNDLYRVFYKNNEAFIKIKYYNLHSQKSKLLANLDYENLERNYKFSIKNN